MLDLAKLESGGGEWQTIQFDLRDVIDESLHATSQLFKDNGVSVDTQLPDFASELVADRDRVMQVMLNLLSNAAKFCTLQQGRVHVTLHQDDTALRVDVADNGIGITVEDQTVIFDKFRQVGDTLTEKPKGSGVGLAISRQIVEHLGGKLWVTSTAGAGATFSFTLPLPQQR